MEVPHSLLVCLGLLSVLVFKEKPKIAVHKFARDTIFYPFFQLVMWLAERCQVAEVESVAF